jgi:hypothetical protein
MIAIVDPWQGDAVVVGEGHAPAVAVLLAAAKKRRERLEQPARRRRRASSSPPTKRKSSSEKDSSNAAEPTQSFAAPARCEASWEPGRNERAWKRVLRKGYAARATRRSSTEPRSSTAFSSSSDVATDAANTIPLLSVSSDSNVGASSGVQIGMTLPSGMRPWY